MDKYSEITSKIFDKEFNDKVESTKYLLNQRTKRRKKIRKEYLELIKTHGRDTALSIMKLKSNKEQRNIDKMLLFGLMHGNNKSLKGV